MIPIYKPYLPAKSLSYAHDALDSTWLSSQGRYLSMVQEKLKDLLGVKYVLPMNNGTTACHMMAKCLYKFHDRYEVIVPNNVYAAAWNGFLFDNTCDLVSIDADLNTWNFDLQELDKAITSHPRAAILVVHNIGNIINVPELKRKYPDRIFLEDDCEGFLGEYEGVKSGTASYASAISFFGNKNITSGEGGAFITNDEETFNFAKRIHSQGQSNKRFVHSDLGYNYRMTNVQAALLYGQLEILPDILQMKQQVFDTYRVALKDRSDVLIQTSDPSTKNANWMFGVRVPGNPDYETAEAHFKNNGVEIRPMFYPINHHSYLLDNPCVSWTDTINAEILNKECFILPSFPELAGDEQRHILKVLNDYLK